MLIIPFSMCPPNLALFMFTLIEALNFLCGKEQGRILNFVKNDIFQLNIYVVQVKRFCGLIVLNKRHDLISKIYLSFDKLLFAFL